MAKRGFTLLEILLVLLLMAFLGISTSYTVSATINAKRKTGAKTELVQEARAVFSILDRDISHAFLMTPHELGWNPQPDPDNPEAPLPTAPTPLTIFKGEPEYLFFSSTSHQRMSADSPENEHHFVSYELKGKELIRAESTRLINSEDKDTTDSYRQFALLESVKSLKFSFWDAKAENWTDTWDTEKAETLDLLPQAVQIKLEYETKAEGEENDKIRTQVIETIFPITEALIRANLGTNTPVTPTTTIGDPNALPPPPPSN